MVSEQVCHYSDDMGSGTNSDAVEKRERRRVTAAETSWALRDCTRASVDVDHVLARRVGLRPMDYTALSHISARELGPQALSGRLGISSGSTTELIDRLERAGHIRRRRDLADRRRVTLDATEEAMQRSIAELAPLLTALDDLAARFTVSERATITGYLRGAAALMRDYAGIASEAEIRRDDEAPS